MSQGFLGSGWSYGLADGAEGIGLDANGRVLEASDEEKIRQSIWLILSTAPGERVARPDFGCGIHDLVFATQSPGAFGAIEAAVEDALDQWEPRIDVDSVSSSLDSFDDATLLIEIQYTVRATNSRYNLVYPFYLAS
jgi:phage baseplate assembly protein W